MVTVLGKAILGVPPSVNALSTRPAGFVLASRGYPLQGNQTCARKIQECVSNPDQQTEHGYLHPDVPVTKNLSPQQLIDSQL